MQQFEHRDYCTRKEISYLIGEHHMSDWRTIQAAIDKLNLGAPCNKQITYYLRKNRHHTFDIQVAYHNLSDGFKGYLAYRTRLATQEAA